MYEFDTEKYNWDMQFIQVNISDRKISHTIYVRVKCYYTNKLALQNKMH